MKSKLLLIGIPLIFAAVVATLTYNHLDSEKDDRLLQINCLAAVIPSVVLHHQQAEIVTLLQNLAEDTKTELPKHEMARPAPFFSSSVDAELIKISDLFKAKTQKLSFESKDVATAVDRAINAMTVEKIDYFQKCEVLMKKVEAKCGDLSEQGRLNSTCVAGFSAELDALIPKK